MKFSDDGRGVNHRAVITRAINKGLIRKSDAAAMGVKDALNLLMSPGFSTKDEVTSVSGLGVGLDVVKTQIERLGGSVSVDSKVGARDNICLTSPCNTGIVPAVFVKAAKHFWCSPQTASKT